MSRLLLYITLLLSGCTVHRELVPENKQCDKLAWYARSVAVLRDIGLNEQDIGVMQNAPNQATFPAMKVRREVFALTTKNPADTYTIFYAKCYAAGFEQIAAVLDEDQYVRINPTAKEQKIAKLEPINKTPLFKPAVVEPSTNTTAVAGSVISEKPSKVVNSTPSKLRLNNVKWKNNNHTEVYQEISNIKWDSWDDRSVTYRELIRRRN